MKAITTALAILLCWISQCLSADLRPSPRPLTHAHAHNDYEHARPLFDALDHGFCSVEADIYLVDGKLLVAHDRHKVKTERTLETLYLNPLRNRARQNNGRIYRNGPPFTLLVDIKSDGESTYAALRDVLRAYDEILTRFSTHSVEQKAVNVILSGNRPRETLAKEETRRAAMDGRLSDLNSNAATHLIPLISDNWALAFKWRGMGPLPLDDKEKLDRIVRETHRQGRQLRFWGTPDRPNVWSELMAAGVDWINTDNLAGVQKFFSNRSEAQPSK